MEKGFDFPSLISKSGGVGLAGSDGEWGAVVGGGCSATAGRWHLQFNPSSQTFHSMLCLTASLPGWPFQRLVICQDPSR